jgi:bacillolysin
MSFLFSILLRIKNILLSLNQTIMQHFSLFKNIQKPLLFIAMILSINPLFSQKAKVLETKPLNPDLLEISEQNSNREWLRIRPELTLKVDDFFEKNRKALGLSAQDEFELVKVETDQLGMKHHRFQQYHQGYKVFGGDYILHEKDGKVVTANGKIATDLPQAKQSLVSEEMAFQAALKAVPSQKYLWLSKNSEKNAKSRTEHPEKYLMPKGEKVWKPLDFNASVSLDNVQLVWQFDIYTEDGQSQTVFINTENGQFASKISLVSDCNPTSAMSTWNGNVPITTQDMGIWDVFFLRNDCGYETNVHVLNLNHSAVYNDANEYVGLGNNWGSQTSAISTFFGLSQTLNYYKQTFGRISYNNANAEVIANNNAGFEHSNGTVYYSNATWDGTNNTLNFGDNGTTSDATDDWNTVDICGHEFTHAVTQYTAGLVYQAESGALNESFSDIFGEMTEYYTQGNADWLVGAQRGAIRSFSNPNSFNHPDSYGGVHWFSETTTCDGNNDYCGVHYNSSVQNHWFWLLVNGGFGSNGTVVQGIGPDDAEKIAYRNLTAYLGSTSNYSDARAGSVQAAIDLFGDCSPQVKQCINAWEAVGVAGSNGIGTQNNLVVNCLEIYTIHDAWGLPYEAKAFSGVFSNCDIASNGALVEFKAGSQIELYPGFFSGNNFTAMVEPCLEGGGLVANAGERSNGSEKNLFTETLDNKSMSLVQASPNPFTDEITFQIQTNQPSFSLTINDLSGRAIYSKKIETADFDGNLTIQTEAFVPGIYFATVQFQNGERKVKKVVKS